ncbi:MAG: hypothetical protein FWG10_00660 [Eubacteriaceae bacterium]|nr:hypothetical protein [Eubacteriaceae bacterium]
MAEADIWIYPSNVNYMPSYNALLELAPVAVDTPVVVNRNVWQFDEYYWMKINESDIHRLGCHLPSGCV